MTRKTSKYDFRFSLSDSRKMNKILWKFSAKCHLDQKIGSKVMREHNTEKTEKYPANLKLMGWYQINKPTIKKKTQRNKKWDTTCVFNNKLDVIIFDYPIEIMCKGHKRLQCDSYVVW